MARKETAAQAAESHYRVVKGSIGNNNTYGPFEQGDVAAASRFGPEIDRLIDLGVIVEVVAETKSEIEPDKPIFYPTVPGIPITIVGEQVAA